MYIIFTCVSFINCQFDEVKFSIFFLSSNPTRALLQMPSGAQVSCRLAPVPPPPPANSPEPLAFPRPVLYLRRLLTELVGNLAMLIERSLTLMVEAVGRLKRLGVGWSSLYFCWPPASEISLPRTWGWRWSRNRGLYINTIITCKHCITYSMHKVHAVCFLIYDHAMWLCTHPKYSIILVCSFWR